MERNKEVVSDDSTPTFATIELATQDFCERFLSVSWGLKGVGVRFLTALQLKLPQMEHL